MDDRVERLWDKAEAAIDRGDIEQAEEYRYLSNLVTYRRRQEAKDLNRHIKEEAER